MITSGDDYPIHQTPEPVQQVFTSDRNFYDRFFFNGCWRAGEPFFAAAMGIYPNLGILDGAFCAIADGVQHCIRVSRRLGADRMDTRCGPLRIEIVRPLKALRVELRHELISADLMFDGRAAPIEEPRFIRRSGPRTVMDLTRLTQHGGYTGSLTLGGRRFEADPIRTWGVRDRSWGVRPVGEREVASVPAEVPPQFFWLWAPANFEELCTHFDVNENSDGSRWHQLGALVKTEQDAAAEFTTAVDWKIDYRPGTRHARAAEIMLRPSSGPEQVIKLKTLYNFYMQGLGYGHPKWGHGMYVGDDVTTYESFKLSEADETNPLMQHIQAVCQAQLGAYQGIGILEMLIVGPHRPSGFKEMLDLHG